MKIMTDYKDASVWKGIYGDAKWEKQLNVYHWLWVQNGNDPVDKLTITCFYRDWSRQKAGEDNYPSCSIEEIPIPMWDMDKCENYVRNRLCLHFKAEEPVCSDDERWKREDKWAVKKKGAKRASKVCTTKEEAEEELDTFFFSDEYFIEHRPGSYIRCEQDWCKVRTWCPVYATS